MAASDRALDHYEPPTLTVLGDVASLTLTPCKPNPAAHIPEHVWSFHCADGSVIVVTSA
jgi:hypothetical protein